MARIISIVNQKGGVGKTTTAVNLASALAAEQQRVLLIDMDPQANATSGLGTNPHQVSKSMYDVLVHQVPILDILVKTPVEGFLLAPSSVDLAGATVELVPLERREYRLYDAIKNIDQHFDYVVVDCPPSLGILTINSIVGSREVLIPVQTEYLALEGLGQLLRTIDLVREHLQPGLQVLGAVLTMYDKRNKLSEAVFHDVYQYFPNKVFGSVIPRNVRLAEAPSHGQPVTEYDKASKGAKAYRKLARELLLTTESDYNPRSQLLEY